MLDVSRIKERCREKCDRISGEYGRMSRDSQGLRYCMEHKYRPLFFRYIQNDQQVMEIGCGSGAFSQLVRQLGAEVISVDFSVGMLNEAKKIDLTRLVCMDSEKLAVRDEAFDVVFTVTSLAYLPNKIECLKEVKKALKDGGIFFVLDMNPGFFGYSRNMKDEQKAIRNEMKKDFMLPLFGEAGFSVLEWGYLNWIPHKTDGLAFHITRLADCLLRQVSFLQPYAMRIYYVARK